jgi:hypothetical protein
LELVDQIQEEYTSGPSASISIKKTEVGTPVIAQYSEDDAWYRAYIESVSGKKYKVGNSILSYKAFHNILSIDIPSASL